MPTINYILAIVFCREAEILQWFSDFEEESRLLWNSPL